MEETRYLYQVNPRVPMVLSEINFRSPKSALLTKDDIVKALPKAVIFRRFPDKIEKVTTLNLDRLHNEKFMTEEEYDAFLLKLDDKRGQVVAPKEVEVPETPVVEEPVGEVPEVSVEPEETVKVEEEVPAAVAEPEAPVEEDVAKALVEDPVISLTAEDDSNDNNQNYQNKKKKHH